MKRGILKRFGRKAREWSKFQKEAKKEAIETGTYICSDKYCRTDEDLEYHHILGRNVAPERYFDKTNLMWLCHYHHRKITNGEK